MRPSLRSAEEVADRQQSDRGGVALRGGGELLGEAVLPAAARLRPVAQQPLDVLEAAVQSLQASPGLRQHPQTGGECRRTHVTLFDLFLPDAPRTGGCPAFISVVISCQLRPKTEVYCLIHGDEAEKEPQQGAQARNGRRLL